MTDFKELGLDDALAEAVHGLGYRRPTAFQREAVRVIARGTTASGVAASGCGKTIGYGLGLAQRLEPERDALQALVLRPTDDAAAATAESLQPLMAARGLSVAALPPRKLGHAPAPSTQVVVGSPGSAVGALEGSALKLEELAALVIDGVSEIGALDGGDALETVAGQVPKSAQRVILTPRMTPDVEDLLERHARRARELRVVPPEVVPLTDRTTSLLASPRSGWMDTLVGVLVESAGRGLDRAVLHCSTDAEAADLERRLSARAFPIREAKANPGVRIVPGDTVPSEPEGLAISWGAPPDLDSVRNRIEPAAASVLFVEPGHLQHVGQLARALEVELTPLRTGIPEETSRSVQRIRDAIREAALQRDLDPYMLLLDPLFQQLGPARVAAAATALARERTPEAPPEPALPAWTRLYFGVGRRDGVRPADIVGAVTGEAPVSGEQIGRIDIRDTHSLVEISADVAETVIKRLAGTTIRGRPANVRLYRE